ncbi:hypothetical protein SAY87_010987 [Trapa incisa]|uniref:Growth-regulating factor n=1 Tax=Trapa incisa TaxID=236973 RepID=A0AAN7GKE7_9MYRT|nr:hypothetical protein SAY87_010987 [Trapa incisa]
MSSGCSSAGGGASGGVCWPPFTTAQWQELEHQALIFKYLKAGLQVPPDLLAPIHRSLESMSARFLQYPTLGYYSFYGKKIDPEPGRCRRTDGKKWRCSKDAHPDSKYCERHMNRGRYRSRKHVESSQTPSSTQPLQSPSLNVGVGTNSGGRAYQNWPVRSNSSVTLSFSAHSQASGLHVESTPYGTSNKYSELKTQVELHKSLVEASSESSRGLDMRSMIDFQNPSSRAPMDLLSESRKSLPLMSNYSSLQKQQQKQHYFLGMEFNSSGSGKPEEQQQQQLVQPFFDEWPVTRESSRPFLDNQRTGASLLSSTQLSMSIEKDPSRLLARDGQFQNEVQGDLCNFQAFYSRPLGMRAELGR